MKPVERRVVRLEDRLASSEETDSDIAAYRAFSNGALALEVGIAETFSVNSTVPTVIRRGASTATDPFRSH